MSVVRVSSPLRLVRGGGVRAWDSAALLLAVVAAAGAFAQPPQRYSVADGSRFWVEGTSTLGRFVCRAGTVGGDGRLDSRTPVRGMAEVTAEVASFDCGQAQMNRDFVRALQAAEHPAIRVVVTQAEVAEAAGEGASRVRATGRLRVAGVERPVAFTAVATPLGRGRMRIAGSYALRMTDFGITPPRGLGGLVRAHDRLTARFDVTLEP